MRRMSFSATVEQMQAGTKTVTRRHRDTWRNLAPGDRLLAVEKAMGLAKGEKQKPIGVIEIVSNEIVRAQPPRHEVDAEARREGFDNWAQFLDVWVGMHGSFDPIALVRRIEFRHVPDELVARINEQVPS